MKSRYLKVRTNGKDGHKVKTLYLQVLKESRLFLLGRPVNPKTTEDASYVKANGTIVDVQHLIDKSLIKWVEDLQENLRYGNLETVAGSRRKV